MRNFGFTSEYYNPSARAPWLCRLRSDIAISHGKVGVYTRFFEFANQRVPLSLFMCNILNHYRLHISQLHCIGAAKISNFEVNCRLLAINPTVHLFRAFYHTCWSNGWVSFSKRAGRLQCYTEKLDALRRWREMFFWVDDALVPWNFAFYTQGLLPRDERPPPGSYSIEDAELINENRIPINAYSEAFLCHMGISRNYFQRPEEVPTFIGEDGRGAAAKKYYCRAHNETYLGGNQVESTDVLAPIPLRSVPGATAEPPRPDATSVGSSEDADVAGAEIHRLRRKPRKAPYPACCQGGDRDSSPQAEAESSRSHAQKLAEEKMALLVKVEQERANSADYKASCHWAVKVFGGVLIRPWLRCWPMALCEAQEGAKSSPLRMICEVCLGRKLWLSHATTEALSAQPRLRSFSRRTLAQLQVPIFARPHDILNPFALEKEIPLKESLEDQRHTGLLIKGDSELLGKLETREDVSVP
ncbi:hypothetical protein Tco_0772541 [Tanacetum coccineum]|uniref:Transposase (putative) gypsy type domain-containing protein n=1 Tax=Tanacetum coccineum TaxID=301880 RepID=A0ABQ4ZLM4_9ASTR